MTLDETGNVGPKDVGRAESLFQSALTKKDPDYAAQILFYALQANPEHEGAFDAILERTPAMAARRKTPRMSGVLRGGPADAFLHALATYMGSPTHEHALSCGNEAVKVGLNDRAVRLATRVLEDAEAGESTIKPPLALRLIDLLGATTALDVAVRAAQYAVKRFPHDQAFAEREKNLLARHYLQENDATGGFVENLRNRPAQQAMHRPVDQAARVDVLEAQFRQSRRLEDFREFVRALHESPAVRREAAVGVLKEGLEEFGERETMWFIREIALDRQWAEVRAHQQVVAQSPTDAALKAEHQQLVAEVQRGQVDFLYEVVSALPNGPDRQRRELELSHALLEAGRYEECIKQAQSVKRRPENRTSALVIMAKAFIQLGFTPEATECFKSLLAELAASPNASAERALEAKYSYAEFLVGEAERTGDALLAQQARKLCSDVLLEDIDYRAVRELSTRADAVLRQSPARST